MLFLRCHSWHTKKLQIWLGWLIIKDIHVLHGILLGENEWKSHKKSQILHGPPNYELLQLFIKPNHIMICSVCFYGLLFFVIFYWFSIDFLLIFYWLVWIVLLICSVFCCFCLLFSIALLIDWCKFSCELFCVLLFFCCCHFLLLYWLIDVNCPPRIIFLPDSVANKIRALDQHLGDDKLSPIPANW